MSTTTESVFKVKRPPLKRSTVEYVALIIAMLTIGHLAAVLLMQEIWPFSDYSMYSSYREPMRKQFMIMAIPEDSAATPFRMRDQHLYPVVEWEVAFLTRRYQGFGDSGFPWRRVRAI